jgi:hypothetical protein
MKYILIMLLFSPTGNVGTMAMAEFDDLDACENAALWTVPHIPSNWRLERHCQPKSSAKPTAKK